MRFSDFLRDSRKERDTIYAMVKGDRENAGGEEIREGQKEGY